MKNILAQLQLREVGQMDFNAEKLRAKINQYFGNKISKNTLGQWANNAYYDILKGGYVEVEKIVLYPFLKILSTFHIEENDKEDMYPCSKENVEKVQEILTGKINFDFDIKMSIPLQVYTMYGDKQYYNKEKREIFVKLRSEIIQYFQKDGKISDDLDLQLKNMMCLDSSKETIQDILEESIFLLLKILLRDNSIETCSEIKDDFRLYAQKSDDNLIVKRLLDYLDSYIGSKNFHLIVSYKKGVPDFFILV